MLCVKVSLCKHFSAWKFHCVNTSLRKKLLCISISLFRKHVMCKSFSLWTLDLHIFFCGNVCSVKECLRVKKCETIVNLPVKKSLCKNLSAYFFFCVKILCVKNGSVQKHISLKTWCKSFCVKNLSVNTSLCKISLNTSVGKDFFL